MSSLLGLPIIVPAIALGGIYMVSKLGKRTRKHRDRHERRHHRKSHSNSSSSSDSKGSRKTYRTARVVKRSLGTVTTA